MTQQKLNPIHVMWDVWRATKSGQDGIAVRQQRRLADIVSYARTHAPFYAEKYRHLPENMTEVQQLPVSTKTELMSRFDDWVTDVAITKEKVEAFVQNKALIGHQFLGQYTVSTTSGTTGVPAILIYDANMMTVVMALNMMRSVPAWLSFGDFMQMLKRGARTASVWATDGHFLGISMAQRQLIERPSRASRMRIISVTSPIAHIVEELNTFQPAMLNAYATAAALLADEQAAGRLHIQPTLLLTSSESLPAGERERISQVFGGAKVRDNYGASEFVAAGYDCGHGWLHINADWLMLEPVDTEYQPVQPGETSSAVLLTNLTNRVQPIIRYEMGDRITVNPELCACGSPLPAIRVEGRTDDVLRLVSSDGTVIPILPLALWSVLKETNGVSRFQVIQTAPTQLEIRLEAKNATESDQVWHTLSERVQSFLASQHLGNVGLVRAPQAPERNAKSGKFRHIWIAKDALSVVVS